MSETTRVQIKLDKKLMGVSAVPPFYHDDRDWLRLVFAGENPRHLLSRLRAARDTLDQAIKSAEELINKQQVDSETRT